MTQERELRWSPRTYLRLFLVLGGLMFVYWGTTGKTRWYLGFGIAAIALGGFGLWHEYTHA